MKMEYGIEIFRSEHQARVFCPPLTTKEKILRAWSSLLLALSYVLEPFVMGAALGFGILSVFKVFG